MFFPISDKTKKGARSHSMQQCSIGRFTNDRCYRVSSRVSILLYLEISIERNFDFIDINFLFVGLSWQSYANIDGKHRNTIFKRWFQLNYYRFLSFWKIWYVKSAEVKITDYVPYVLVINDLELPKKEIQESVRLSRFERCLLRYQLLRNANFILSFHPFLPFRHRSWSLSFFSPVFEMDMKNRLQLDKCCGEREREKKKEKEKNSNVIDIDDVNLLWMYDV